MGKILLILAIFDPLEAIFTVLELFTCTNHPPLKYCPVIGRHNMARIPDDLSTSSGNVSSVISDFLQIVLNTGENQRYFLEGISDKQGAISFNTVGWLL